MGSEDQDDLLASSPSEFARRMAEGEGDYMWAGSPEGLGGSGFVPSLDVAFPQWDPAFLSKVQDSLDKNWEAIADWEAVETDVEQSDDAFDDSPTHRSTLVRIGDVVAGGIRRSSRSRRRHMH